MGTDDLHYFIDCVFRSGSQLGSRILGFFHLIEAFSVVRTEDDRTRLNEIIEAAPPLLEKFYRLYAPKGLKGSERKWNF